MTFENKDREYLVARIEVEQEAVEELLAENARLITALRDYITDHVYSAYYTGIEKDGKWQNACMRDAEWLTIELGLGDGWTDTAVVKDGFPALIERLVARAALKGETG